jgi:pseudouridine synthase
VDLDRARLTVDGAAVRAARRVYLALNKPRGVLVSRAPERGARTVFDLLAEAGDHTDAAHLSAVGRLDKASEGLLLVTNDTRWAARLLDPASHVPKTYHVQIGRVPDAALCAALERGADDDGEHLAVRSAAVLRAGERGGWLVLVLDEGGTGTSVGCSPPSVSRSAASCASPSGRSPSASCPRARCARSPRPSARRWPRRQGPRRQGPRRQGRGGQRPRPVRSWSSSIRFDASAFVRSSPISSPASSASVWRRSAAPRSSARPRWSTDPGP